MFGDRSFSKAINSRFGAIHFSPSLFTSSYIFPPLALMNREFAPENRLLSRADVIYITNSSD
jgi:hypothetical protein